MKTLSMLAAGICATFSATLAAPVLAQAPQADHHGPQVTLTRLDCGTPQAPTDVAQRFTDTYAYNGVKIQFVYSCYLIRHGDDYMVWDTGHPMNAPNVAPKVSLVDLLGKLEVKPENVKYVGISHYHGDHVGQADSFAKSTLLIGKGDWEIISDPAKAPPNAPANPKSFAPWISGGGKVEPVVGDKDVFGDGTVVMLSTPGHTPGHHSLLVRLPQTGNVLLTGDAAHFRENYDSDGVPSFNYHHGDTVASLERFKKIAANLKATVIIQHDARDVDKLPAYPEAAK